MPNARDVAVGGVKIAGLVAAVWVGLIIVDLLTFYLIYAKATETLILFGAMGEAGANIMGLLFAVFVTICFHGLSRHLLLRRRRALFAMVVVAIVWFGMVGIVQAPYMADALFNGQGSALYKYAKMPDGTIVRYPRGLTHDPKTNRPLADFNTATADEYLAQEAKRQPKPEAKKEEGFFDWLFGETKPDPPEWALRMDIERIDIYPDKTVLHYGVTRTDNERAGWFYQPSGNYLSDDTGQTYDLASDDAAYPSWVDAETHKGTVTSGKRALVHEVRRDETYRFTNTYPALKEGIRNLRLHDSRFAEIDLEYQLWQAQLRAEVQKKKDLEARMAQAERDAKAAAEAPPTYVIPAPLIPESASSYSSVSELKYDPTLYALDFGSQVKRFRVTTFTRKVKVNRFRRPEDMLNLAGWKADLRGCGFSEIPTVDLQEVEVVFFKTDPDDTAVVGSEGVKVYDLLGLKPDPYATAAANEQDLTLADKYPNAVQWRIGVGQTGQMADIFRESAYGFQMAIFRTQEYRAPFTITPSGRYDHRLHCGGLLMAGGGITEGIKSWWMSGVRK